MVDCNIYNTIDTDTVEYRIEDSISNENNYVIDLCHMKLTKFPKLDKKINKHYESNLTARH